MKGEGSFVLSFCSCGIKVLIRDWGVACEVRLGLFYMSEIQKVKQYITIVEKGEGRCA